MLDFNDKVVLITGASRGIGRATAIQFAAQGAQVAIHYHRNRDAAQETRAALPGGPHHLVQADVKDAGQVAQMVDEIVAQLGGIDVLVNNAGIYEEHPLVDTDYAKWQESWRQTLETNLLGAANVTYCVAQQMMARNGGRGSGRIVNVSSRGAFRGEPEAPAYGASKAGLNAMSQSLARYLAPYNVTVAAVAPGWVETDMASEALQGATGDEIRAQSPLGRVARPEEVAQAILFLASDEAHFATGAILDVNGASYLRT